MRGIRIESVVAIALFAWLTLWLTGSLTRPANPNRPEKQTRAEKRQTEIIAGQRDQFADLVKHVDAEVEKVARQKSVAIAPLADQKLVLRRVHLALVGSIPSLEEVRQFEHDCNELLVPVESSSEATQNQANASNEVSLEQNRMLAINRAVDRLLSDDRYADYFAERLARSLVPDLPVEPFFIYRRRRFTNWLSDQLKADRPVDALVRELITSEGMWMDKPAVNYITGHEMDPVRLANRTSRAFLGLRLDCAQCHDHPFTEWKQKDFHQLAAFFGQVKLGGNGIYEDRTAEYTFEDLKTNKKIPVQPAVPFAANLLDRDGRPRQRLANWITHRDNHHLSKAMTNRVWRLLFGKGFTEPVDDLEQPNELPKVLDMIAEDFRTHHYSLKRLIRVCLATKTFARESDLNSESAADREAVFAAYPLTRLRTEQVVNSLVQTSSLRTIDGSSEFLKRFLSFVNSVDFHRDYGDAGEEELMPRGGNITQRLLMMNGKVANERTEASIFTAAGRINALAPDNQAAIETAYLTCLCRLPTKNELEHFRAQLEAKGANRERVMEDMFWALVNSTEFAWNR